MVSLVRMPKSDLTMREGTILKWYKKESDRVERGDPLVQILAEKSTIDLEATISGTVRKIYYKEQTDVPVGKVIIAIGSPEEALPEIGEEPPAAETQPPATPVEKPRVDVIRGEIRASPLAKRIAKEQGIDLSIVPGTGPGGRVTEADLQKFLETRAIPSTAERRVREVIPLTGMRKIVAERMSLSGRTYPRITLTAEVDASEMKRFRERLKDSENIDVSYTDILVKAIAKALTKYPMLNSTLEGDQIRVYNDVNVGVAVVAPLGLMVPVIHHADSLSLTEISKLTRALIEKARSGSLSKEELSWGTFTITNLGMFGVDFFSPLINPPETAILGVGNVRERPVAEDGRIVAKPTMFLSLSVDHRVVDGAPAAKFLATVKRILEGVELTE